MVLTKYDILSQLKLSPPLIENIRNKDIQVQPNGFDVTISAVSSISGTGKIGFYDVDTQRSDVSKIIIPTDKEILLEQGSYLVTFNEVINLPNNLMAIGRPRSSLLRMGVTVETAVWDAGFSGISSSLLIVNNPDGFRITTDARVMQLVFIQLTSDTQPFENN